MDTDIGNTMEHIPEKLLVPQPVKKCFPFMKPQLRSQVPASRSYPDSVEPILHCPMCKFIV
jgi:hypothetical protein